VARGPVWPGRHADRLRHREKEVPERELILEYLDFVDDVLDELECRKEVEYVQTMLDRGTGADRQLKVFADTGDLRPRPTTYREAYRLPASLDGYLGGLDGPSYDALVGNAIVGGHDPVEVVLMEIEPRWQKTWPDFAITERVWGVRAVDTSAVRREGRQLFYDRDGRRVRIRRIYNRVIPEELDRRHVELPFDYRDDLDVEWAGHPAWYFRISKFSIPWLRHPSVPRTWFLHELDRLPDDRERYVLKPLYSFAGGGIVFAPTDADIAAIPAEERMHYILQERIDFAPVIETPEGPTQVEIRIMYVWVGELRPVMALLRMGRGKMMGVDHNKGLRWVGASAAFTEGA
jgi:hypothetical protein